MKILSTSIFLFFALSSFSQSSISLEGGWNRANLIHSTPENGGINIFQNQYKNFFHLGINYTQSLSNKFNLVTLVQYSQKGHGYIDSPLASSLVSGRFQYLDLLPTFEYKVISQIGLFAGGNIGYLLRIDSKSGSQDWIKVDNMGGLSDFDFGIVAGIRFYLGNIGVHGLINQGITKNLKFAFTGSAGNPISDFYSRNRNIQVGVTLFL